jgi:hypothetical protein
VSVDVLMHDVMRAKKNAVEPKQHTLIVTPSIKFSTELRSHLKGKKVVRAISDFRAQNWSKRDKWGTF